MKWRFEWVYWMGLAALLIAVFWSVWAVAQETNAVPAAAATTNKLQSALAKLPEHALTFNLDRVPFLHDNTFLEQPLWKYIASAIYMLLAFLVAKVVDWTVKIWLRTWADRTKTKHDELLLELLRGPVKVIAFVIFLNIGLSLFEWPPRAQLFLSRGLIVAVACSVIYVILSVIDLLLGLWRENIVAAQDKAFADQLLPLISKAAKVLIVIVGGLVTADNLDIKVGSLLAGLSVGGLALGLAAQDTVANLFGAVAIFLDKPFHIGDRIRVQGVDGTVENIGLRSTRLRNLEGYHVTIPNKLMGNEIITNVTRRPSIKTEMNFGLAYDTPVEKVRQATLILQDILGTHPRTDDLIISFNKFGDSALNIFVAHFWNGADARRHFADLQELNLKIKERFEAEKIEFAFPTQTIYLKPEAGK